MPALTVACSQTLLCVQQSDFYSLGRIAIVTYSRPALAQLPRPRTTEEAAVQSLPHAAAARLLRLSPAV